jgi:hypothetical protein
VTRPSGPVLARALALAAALVFLTAPMPAAAQSSPVDGLTAAEIRDAVAVVEGINGSRRAPSSRS